MKISPFMTISSYSDMLNKIGVFNFICVLISSYSFYCVSSEFRTFIDTIPLQIQIYNIEISFSLFIISVVISLLFRAVKLHDKISDIFLIRKWYDINFILIPLALGSNANLNRENYRKLIKERKNLMGKCFYKYIENKVSDHIKTMIMDQFTWYWITVELGFIVFLSAIIYFFLKEYFISSILLFSVLVLYIVSRYLKHLCIPYTLNEVDQILEDEDVKVGIRKEINAL